MMNSAVVRYRLLDEGEDLVTCQECTSLESTFDY